MSNIHRGMSLREAIRIAVSFGCEVKCPRATGELRITSETGYKIVVSVRKKDATAAMRTFLRKVLKEVMDGEVQN